MHPGKVAAVLERAVLQMREKLLSRLPADGGKVCWRMPARPPLLLEPSALIPAPASCLLT